MLWHQSDLALVSCAVFPACLGTILVHSLLIPESSTWRRRVSGVHGNKNDTARSEGWGYLSDGSALSCLWPHRGLNWIRQLVWSGSNATQLIQLLFTGRENRVIVVIGPVLGIQAPSQWTANTLPTCEEQKGRRWGKLEGQGRTLNSPLSYVGWTLGHRPEVPFCQEPMDNGGTSVIKSQCGEAGFNCYVITVNYLANFGEKAMK